MKKRQFLACLAVLACNPLRLIRREPEKPLRPFRVIEIPKHIREHPNYLIWPDRGEELILRGTTHYVTYEVRDAKGRKVVREKSGLAVLA